jgi:Oxidoreductase-like protein, N-terminal
MLPGLARTWRASRLRQDKHLAMLEQLRYSSSSKTSSLQQEDKNISPSSVVGPAPPNNSLPTPPIEPAPEECCGKGCEECVWTVYWNNLREYEIIEAAKEGVERPLDPFELLEQRLAAKEKKQK